MTGAADALMSDHAQARLSEEKIAWLTTVRADGQPQSSPVWFVWHGGGFWLFSQPEAHKVANIQSCPLVSIHLDGAGKGAPVITVEGRAELPGHVEAATRDLFKRKYGGWITSLGETPESYLEDFSEPIVVHPIRARVFRTD